MDQPCMITSRKGVTSTCSTLVALLVYLSAVSANAAAIGVPTPTPTVAPTSACAGDCNGDGDVTIGDLLALVNIALGNDQASACPYGVPDAAAVDVALILQGANNALNGCLSTTPTPTPTCIPLPSLTPRFSFTLEPNLLHVGEHAKLTIEIEGGAPGGGYALLTTSDLVDGRNPAYVDPAGYEVDFDLTGIQSGTTDLVLDAFYTFDLPGPEYCYASRYQNVLSPPFPITVAPAGT